jgi:hypothetical protein
MGGPQITAFLSRLATVVGKYPAASREWIWQWVFAATRQYADPATGHVRRHHLHETVIQRTVRAAWIPRWPARIPSANRSPPPSLRYPNDPGPARPQQRQHNDDPTRTSSIAVQSHWTAAERRQRCAAVL